MTMTRREVLNAISECEFACSIAKDNYYLRHKLESMEEKLQEGKIICGIHRIPLRYENDYECPVCAAYEEIEKLQKELKEKNARNV